jgi:hypothetical protein
MEIGKPKFPDRKARRFSSFHFPVSLFKCGNAKARADIYE